jgi:hypothetical protein
MKNVQEWEIGFDQLYNNITSNKAPGLNSFEKSRFLTDAQEAIVVGLYNGSFGKAFESTEDVSNYLAPLVAQANFEQVITGDFPKVSATKSFIFELPDGKPEILFRTLELCTLTEDCGDVQAVVVPVTQDEYWRTSRDPFKRQNERKVLRLIYSDASVADGNLSVQKYSELISDFTIKDYTVRYIKRPEPIILRDLPNGLSIQGKTAAQTCLLDDALHQAILTEAVRLAKAAWMN